MAKPKQTYIFRDDESPFSQVSYGWPVHRQGSWPSRDFTSPYRRPFWRHTGTPQLQPPLPGTYNVLRINNCVVDRDDHKRRAEYKTLNLVLSRAESGEWVCHASAKAALASAETTRESGAVGRIVCQSLPDHFDWKKCIQQPIGAVRWLDPDPERHDDPESCRIRLRPRELQSFVGEIEASVQPADPEPPAADLPAADHRPFTADRPFSATDSASSFDSPWVSHSSSLSTSFPFPSQSTSSLGSLAHSYPLSTSFPFPSLSASSFGSPAHSSTSSSLGSLSTSPSSGLDNATHTSSSASNGLKRSAEMAGLETKQ